LRSSGSYKLVLEKNTLEEPDHIQSTLIISDDEESMEILFSEDISSDFINQMNNALETFPTKYVERKVFEKVNGDSLAEMIYQLINNQLSPHFQFYKLASIYVDSGTVSMKYRLNKESINLFISDSIEKYSHPENRIIYPLFTQKHSPPDRDAIKNLKLLLPCENVPVPHRALLLPNAPRTYRNGTHRGIDFYVNWGSPVRAVADGTIIRSENYYEEVPPDFRKELLAEAKKLGHTPSDIFEHILVGQAVYIDHGFDLVPGYRAFSIYAHLSHINPEIKPGKTLSKGDIIGLSGNSGTEPSTLGSRKGAHLHWELILQDAGGEYYLGQGYPTKKLIRELNRIFGE